VKDAGGATELTRVLPSPVATAPVMPTTTSRPSFGSRLRSATAAFWLRVLFFIAQRMPWFARAGKPVFVLLASACSRSICTATRANGRRILGERVDDATLKAFTRGVVGNFFDFVLDVGRSVGRTREQLAAEIEQIDGHDRYVATRAARRGAIVLTAHMGSFEMGAAALLEHEPRIHVVFKRDSGRFERIRQSLREQLGVVEQAVDEGWGVWVTLRDALRANEVVAIQGDRVVPGQKGRRMPFLGGHLMLPTGPVKLAMASGAPIVPVFSVRTPRGGVRLFIEEAITVGDDADEALARVAAVIAKYVAAYPQQWLVLHPAFDEDATAHRVEQQQRPAQDEQPRRPQPASPPPPQQHRESA
jgi:phosphatidylinositol dimannoside acyltransferase